MDARNPTRYPTEVFWSDEDEGFIALAPDLPGCSAWGRTQATALRQLADAVEAWIENAKAIGNPVPPPSAHRSPSDFSGKLLTRLPKDLHAALARHADAQGVSLNSLIISLLSSALRQEDTMTAVKTVVSDAMRGTYAANMAWHHTIVNNANAPVAWLPANIPVVMFQTNHGSGELFYKNMRPGRNNITTKLIGDSMVKGRR